MPNKEGSPASASLSPSPDMESALTVPSMASGPSVPLRFAAKAVPENPSVIAIMSATNSRVVPLMPSSFLASGQRTTYTTYYANGKILLRRSVNWLPRGRLGSYSPRLLKEVELGPLHAFGNPRLLTLAAQSL